MPRNARRALVIVVALILGVGAAWLAVDLSSGGPIATTLLGQAPEGRWRTAPERTVDEQIAMLEAIGYVDGVEPAGAGSGVTLHARDRAWQGLNLYTSGHDQIALLVDMDGAVLHEWRADFRELFPEHAAEQLPEEQGMSDRRERFRRAHLLEDGHLLVIYEGFGIARLDRASRMVWGRVNGAHHDLWVGPDGHIWVLTRTAHVVERYGPDPVLEDFIVELDADGTELRRLSILDAIRRSDYRTLLEHGPRRGDLLHTNTIEVLSGPGTGRAPFLEGRVLVSMPKNDTIALVDMDLGKLVWSMTGLWDFQHQPTLLDSGNLLVFDNHGERGRSKVVEVDPFSQQVVWAYRGTKANGFYTNSCGSNQRLPNGNTLITESDAGRAFEVDPDGAVVWEFLNPARAGLRDELIATLFEVERLPADRWAPAPTGR